MVYAIYEGNMDRLEKKLNHIYNKCKAYGCDFHYEQVGETYKEVTDERGNKHMARFILVEAEGTAIVNNWEFAASVEHTEKGNIFKGILGIEVPRRYYDNPPVCEHCNIKRHRVYTYIIRNKETGEFKQVGRACLKDFTHGMSAEAITQYISLFDSLIEGEAPDTGARIEHYLPKEEYLRYAAETIRHFGYVKADDVRQNTSVRALDYYEADRNRAVSREYLEHLQEEMSREGFNINHPETVQLVKDALAWVEAKTEDSNYIHNLKTVCSLDYVKYKNVGLLASLFPAYNRELERTAKWQAEHAVEANSQHVGVVGSKVSFKANTLVCVTGWETEYGYMHVYKMIDENGNVYTWKTTKSLPDTTDGLLVTGTVKAHNEFRGIKQTELTRCFTETLK